MFTIQQKNKTVGMRHKDNHYIIGFNNVTQARKVQYAMHPEPRLILTRGDGLDIGSVLESLKPKGSNAVSIVIDTEATLFIPKFKGESTSPMNDGSFHMNTVPYDDFIAYPFTKMLGVIIPYDLVYEDDNEFTFRSQVIEPFFIPEFYAS